MCQVEAPVSTVLMAAKQENQELKQSAQLLSLIFWFGFVFPLLLHVLALWFPKYDLQTPEFPEMLSGGSPGQNSFHTKANVLFYTNFFTSLQCFSQDIWYGNRLNPKPI